MRNDCKKPQRDIIYNNQIKSLAHSCNPPLNLVQFLFVKALFEYFNGVRLELSKVTWPKKEEVIRLTLLVFVTSGIVAAYVGGLDFTFTKLLSFIVAR